MMQLIQKHNGITADKSLCNLVCNVHYLLILEYKNKKQYDKATSLLLYALNSPIYQFRLAEPENITNIHYAIIDCLIESKNRTSTGLIFKNSGQREQMGR
ncbi:MAG: hypothetical protein HWD59_12935 [Coxiellaceae bacterium]|nr:MAG: hypothetical protein HWD59_12935 [Coxiellaceae bacterium]